MNADSRPLSSRRQGAARRDRRGVAVILVLTLIAITLSLSYAVMRSQGTIARIQANSDLRANARQAAMTGYLVGLRQMHNSSWAGADTSFTGNAGTNMSYQVSYATGDASLTSTSANYSLYPYRITLTVTGTAVDPANASLTVSDHIQAVVQLVPRQMPAEPADFGSMTQFTAYQTAANNFQIEPRRQIQGAVRIQGPVVLDQESPSYNNAQKQYVADLNVLRTTSNLDYRPFTGPLSLPLSNTSGNTRNQLSNDLALTLTDISQTSPSSDWTFPTNFTTYRLYTGGKSYSVASASSTGSTVQNTTLAADPLTNPAGIFSCNGDITLGNNVTLQGTLLSTGRINLSGTGLNLQPASLQPLRGTTAPVQLPVLIASNGVTIQSTATGTLSGFVASFSDFTLNQRSQATTFQIVGRVVASQFTLHDCSEWTMTSATWQLLYNLFSIQQGSAGGVSNFVTYLKNLSFPSLPTVTLAPETSSVVYHWQSANNRIFIQHTSDPGLRWDVQSWKEYP